MSQFILDEQIDVDLVLIPIQRWATAQRITDLRPDERILDDRIPTLLVTLNEPTFITIDFDFWDAEWLNPNYCVLFFALRKDQQSMIPGLLRTLLRKREFATRASRMGKVVRISKDGIEYLQFRNRERKVVPW